MGRKANPAEAQGAGGPGHQQPETVPIPPGAFLMGIGQAQIDWLAKRVEQAREWREKGYFAREQPQHQVELPAFAIGRHPVTVGQYRVFLEAGGYGERRFWTGAGWAWRQAKGRVQPDYWEEEAWAGDDRLPVVGVSWYEAYAYCRWLGEATDRNCRLPTEAEWEKAASWQKRGNGERPKKRLFPWGDEFDAGRCNGRASGLGRTVPVGGYSPVGDSPYGCAGMAGNVSEWTLSRFQPYPYVAGEGRDDPEGEAGRVTRGGSWHSPVLRLRTMSRGMNDPFFTDNDLGFRCVLVA